MTVISFVFIAGLLATSVTSLYPGLSTSLSNLRFATRTPSFLRVLFEVCGTIVLGPVISPREQRDGRPVCYVC